MKTKADLLKQIEATKIDIEMTENHLAEMGIAMEEDSEIFHLQNELTFLSDKLTALWVLERIGEKG